MDEEKAASAVALGLSPHVHHRTPRERLRHFLHPDGRRIHVANSPEEEKTLRRRLETFSEPFDIYISGTPQHLDALRKAHSHHEQRCNGFRDQHSDLYDQFHQVHTDLDALAQELDKVAEHGVQLDASFSRYGYSAHLRSKGEGSSEEHSTTSTPRTSIADGKEPSCGDYTSPLKLFKVPIVRQYFHKGLIWRASDEEEVESFELFVDLLYVGIIAINGDYASETPTGKSLLRFVITFTLSYKIWSDMTLVISWFETNDIFQRVCILFLLACLFGYTTNITEAFETTYAQLIGFYLAARLFMACYLLLVAYLVPMIRGVMYVHVGSTVLGAALWIGSIYVAYPNQLAMIFIAMLNDQLGHVWHMIIISAADRMGPRSKAWADRRFEFFPALNIEHRTERMNAFVTLVFGYTVVAILYQNRSHFGLNAFLGKAILGVVQAFCFNWIYFEVDGTNMLMHAIRRHKWTAFAWSNAHLPFIMSFVLAGGALARLVIADDCPDANSDDLTDTYQARSEPVISPGIRWFYAAGLGVALACMGCISMSHVHKELSTLRMRKRHRLAMRFVTSIVLICLPLADKLNSLQLIGTATALVALALCCELWGASCSTQSVWDRSKVCRYTGRCGKKDLQAMVENGGEVVVESLGRGDDSGVTVH